MIARTTCFDPQGGSGSPGLWRLVPFPVFLFFFFWSNPSAAQVEKEFPFLRSEKIYVIHHDHADRLIVGTDVGLYLYDGYKMKFLLDKNAEVLSLKISRNNVVFADAFSPGLLMISLNAGGALPPETGTRLRRLEATGYRYLPSLSGTHTFPLIRNDTVYAEIDDRGQILFECHHRLLRSPHFRSGINLRGGSQVLLEDSVNRSLVMLDCRSLTVRKVLDRRYGLFKDATQVNDSTIALVKPSTTDSLLFFTYDRNLNLKERRGVVLDRPVRNICPAGNGVFISFLSGGFVKYNRELEPSQLYSGEYLINFVHEFRGHYFVGTDGQGLHIVRNAAGRSPVRQLLATRNFQCMYADEDGIGYAALEGDHLAVTRGNASRLFTRITGEEPLLINRISELYTFGPYLLADSYYLTPGADSFRNLPGPGAFKSMTIYRNRLWLCCHNGLFGVSQGPGGLLCEPVLEERVYGIAFLGPNQSLIIRRDGLSLFNTETGAKQPLPELSRQTGAVRSLLVDTAGGMVYIASIRGLYRLPVADLFDASNATSRLEQLINHRTDELKLHNGLLFANHGVSLTQIDLTTDQSVYYHPEVGLPDQMIRDFELRGDSVYIATSGAIFGFPVRLTPHIPDPEPELIRVRTNRRSLPSSEAYVFNPGETILRFFLTNSSWQPEGRFSYQFRLLPLQEEWSAPERPELVFYDLPQGEYRLELRLWNPLQRKAYSEVRSVSFEVVPFFWETAAFRSVLLLLAATGVFLVLYFRNQRIHRKKIRELNHEKEVSELKFRVIRTQINPHFIFNCLNSITLLNHKRQHEEVGRYIQLFSRMIRTNLNISERVFHSVEEEIAHLNDYLGMENLRFKDKLSASVDLEDPALAFRKIPSFFVQLFAENSIKHGLKPEGTLVIHVCFRALGSGELEVVIQDNGKGFTPKDSPGAGIGLQLVKDRIRIYRELYRFHIQLTQDNLPVGTGTITRLIMRDEAE